MKNKIILAAAILIIIGIIFVVRYWVNTQPVRVVDTVVSEDVLAGLPGRNRCVIELVESREGILLQIIQM